MEFKVVQHNRKIINADWILIESQWNLKDFLIQLATKLKDDINRITVEFKDGYRGMAEVFNEY